MHVSESGVTRTCWATWCGFARWRQDDVARTWCESQTKGGALALEAVGGPRPLSVQAVPSRWLAVVLVEGERKGDVLQQLLEAGAPGV